MGWCWNLGSSSCAVIKDVLGFAARWTDRDRPIGLRVHGKGQQPRGFIHGNSSTTVRPEAPTGDLDRVLERKCYLLEDRGEILRCRRKEGFSASFPCNRPERLYIGEFGEPNRVDGPFRPGKQPVRVPILPGLIASVGQNKDHFLGIRSLVKNIPCQYERHVHIGAAARQQPFERFVQSSRVARVGGREQEPGSASEGDE